MRQQQRWRHEHSSHFVVEEAIGHCRQCRLPRGTATTEQLVNSNVRHRRQGCNRSASTRARIASHSTDCSNAVVQYAIAEQYMVMTDRTVGVWRPATPPRVYQTLRPQDKFGTGTRVSQDTSVWVTLRHLWCRSVLWSKCPVPMQIKDLCWYYRYCIYCHGTPL